VPDLRAGLLAGGWRDFDTEDDALAGDIGVQNGTQPGTADNPYENHVGVVVMDPNGGGSLVILSNSSSRGAFVYVDDSLDSMITAWSNAVLGWFAEYRPNDGGHVQFDLQPLSNLAGPPHPLIRLSDVLVAVGDVVAPQLPVSPNPLAVATP
jgi:hypothetical protein